MRVITVCSRYDASMRRQGSWVFFGLLGSLAACSPEAPPAVPAGAARTGAEIFDGNCTACHQPNGRGIPGVYPSLAGSATVLGDPKALARWISRGRRTASMPVGRFPTAMPRFGWLEPDEAAALLTYIRSSFGNHAAPVDKSTMAEALEE